MHRAWAELSAIAGAAEAFWQYDPSVAVTAMAVGLHLAQRQFVLDAFAQEPAPGQECERSCEQLAQVRGQSPSAD